jgi:hypothetical protein
MAREISPHLKLKTDLAESLNVFKRFAEGVPGNDQGFDNDPALEDLIEFEKLLNTDDPWELDVDKSNRETLKKDYEENVRKQVIRKLVLQAIVIINKNDPVLALRKEIERNMDVNVEEDNDDEITPAPAVSYRAPREKHTPVLNLYEAGKMALRSLVEFAPGLEIAGLTEKAWESIFNEPYAPQKKAALGIPNTNGQKPRA